MLERLLPPEDKTERRRQNRAIIVRLVMVTLLGGAGLWLVLELDKSRREQECLESGRRKCALIQTP